MTIFLHILLLLHYKYTHNLLNIKTLIYKSPLIQDEAFAYCDNLKRIDIPLSVESIEGNGCFISDSPKKVFIPQILITDQLQTENVEFVGRHDEDETVDE